MKIAIQFVAFMFLLAAISIGTAQERRPVSIVFANNTDAQIEKRLDEQTEFDFDQTPLSDVVASITKKHDMNVVINEMKLDELGIDISTSVSCQLKGVTLRSALKMALKPLDLAYLVKGEVLMITTEEDHEANLVGRLFDVSGIIDTMKTGDVYSLLDVITGSCQPEIWDEVGGPGTINMLTVGGSTMLVVSSTQQSVEEVGVLLKQIESTLGKPAKVADDKTVKVRVYPLAKKLDFEGAEYAKLIQTAFESDKWVADETFVKSLANTLVVKHNGAVQDKVYELLAELNVLKIQPGSSSGGGGFSGGGGNAPPSGGGLFQIK